MTTNKQLAQQLLDCFNTKDLAGLDGIITDTVKHTAASSPFAADLEGRGAYIAFMGGKILPAFKTLDFRAKRIHEDTDAGTIILEWAGSFVTAAGKSFSNRGVFVIECHDGRIDWVRDYFDATKTKAAGIDG